MSVTSSQSSERALWQRGLGATGGLGAPLVAFLGVTLFVRVLTDDRSSDSTRLSGSLNSSAVIAVLLILLSATLLVRRREGLRVTLLAAVWLAVWTVVAVSTRGASTETIREGVREGSVLALAVIVYNARGAVTVAAAARLVQFIGFVPAIVALYQLAAGTGMDIDGNLRSNGTFAHPNSAAMFFGIALIASLWLYLRPARRLLLDALLVALFGAAALATFSLDGIGSLIAMLVAFAALRPGSLRVKILPLAIAGVIVLAFAATPLGAQRVVNESHTSLATAERGEANSSLAWRIHKWKAVLKEWEQSPVFGEGLGTTTTVESTVGNRLRANLPHNEYLRYLYETGVIGLAVLLWALALMVRGLLRRRGVSGKAAVGTVDAPTLALIVVFGCLVNSLADNTFIDSPTCYAAALIVFATLAPSGIGKLSAEFRERASGASSSVRIAPARQHSG